MPKKDDSRADDRYDPNREGQLDRYDLGHEELLVRYDPNDEDMEDSLEHQNVKPDEHQDSNREARRERRDRHDFGRGDWEQRRHRHSFGSRFLQQMMEGIRESMEGIRDSVREVVGIARFAHQGRQRPRLEARSPHPRSQVPSRERLTAFREFRQLNPPTFNGKGDPRVAEEWLECINQFLDTLDIEDDGQRVSLAVFQLTSDAHHWWKVTDHSIGETWEEFEEAFQNKYLSNSAVNRLRYQFEELTQGDRSVDKYAQEFNSLSRYAPDLVADEDLRCRRFEEGLRSSIRDRVMPHLFSDFAKMLESARAVERGWELTQKEREGRKFQGTSSSKGDHQSKKRKSSSSESGSEIAKISASVGSSSRGARHSTSHRPLVCHLCDQPDHIMVQCPRFAQARASVSGPRPQEQRTGGFRPFDRGGVVCFKCRQPGHLRRECPVLASASHTASIGQTQTPQSRPFQSGQNSQYARPQAQAPQGGGRGGGAGRGKMTVMTVIDEPEALWAYQEAPVGPSELRGYN